MTALWTSKAMAAAMGARRQGELPAEITGISIDSRTLGKSAAFFAIKGAARATRLCMDNPSREYRQAPSRACAHRAVQADSDEGGRSGAGRKRRGNAGSKPKHRGRAWRRL